MLCKRDTFRLFYHVWWEKRSGMSINLKCYDKVSVDGFFKTTMFKPHTMGLGSTNWRTKKDGPPSYLQIRLAWVFIQASLFIYSVNLKWIDSVGPSKDLVLRLPLKVRFPKIMYLIRNLIFADSQAKFTDKKQPWQPLLGRHQKVFFFSLAMFEARLRQTMCIIRSLGKATQDTEPTRCWT